MRKIIFQVMVSLDGYIEGPNGELDWHNVDEAFNDYAIELLNKVDTLLFGRKTYGIMAAYWPTPFAMENDPVVAAKMNSLPKLVASRTLQQTNWNNTQLISENVATEIARIKTQPGKDIALLGSSDLALTLSEHGLIDEYRIMINPIVLGKGRSLFMGANKKFKLDFVRSLSFDSGNTLMVYRPISPLSS